MRITCLSSSHQTDLQPKSALDSRINQQVTEKESDWLTYILIDICSSHPILQELKHSYRSHPERPMRMSRISV